MSKTSILIESDDMPVARAVSIAIQDGLAQAGFSAVNVEPMLDEAQLEAGPASLYDELRQMRPDLFEQPVDISMLPINIPLDQSIPGQTETMKVFYDRIPDAAPEGISAVAAVIIAEEEEPEPNE